MTQMADALRAVGFKTSKEEEAAVKRQFLAWLRQDHLAWVEQGKRIALRYRWVANKRAHRARAKVKQFEAKLASGAAGFLPSGKAIRPIRAGALGAS